MSADVVRAGLAGRFRFVRCVCVGLVAAVTLFAGATPAGAAQFGPVDPTLADGASGSLRDVIENQATNQGPDGAGCIPFGASCGDTVLLESGATYTLTCAGGGALAHGNTPLQLKTTGGAAPATITQTCAGTRTLDQAGDENVVIVNVVLVGPGGALMSPACNPPTVTHERTWGTFESPPQTTNVTLPPAEEFETRVLGVVVDASGREDVVFDQTTDDGPDSHDFDQLVKAARTAVAPGAVRITGPEREESDVTTSERVSDVFADASATAFTGALRFGPATYFTGNELSELHFIPAGCTSRDDVTSWQLSFEHQTQAVVTHDATYEVTGYAGALAAAAVTADPRFTG